MKNYEAEKLKKIIAQKEAAMKLQVEETDRLRKLRMYSEEDMRDAFYAGKNYYDFEVWITDTRIHVLQHLL